MVSESPRWSSHVLRQLQLVVPGGAITWYLDTISHLAAASTDVGSWGRTGTLGSLSLAS
ncbi:hypothetical protein K438DRAFT_476391 [Mycena galopus ATCC 62051]|nr:hypothetical protein K438DRAFT_476391 [Mycena galopus ATCC 62051]